MRAHATVIQSLVLCRCLIVGAAVRPADSDSSAERSKQRFWGHTVRWADVLQNMRIQALKPDHQIVIEMPSSSDPYNFDNSPGDWSYSQYRQDKLLAPILNQISGGFFVECAARDGESDSKTVYYENQGWTGLLIEPSKQLYSKIREKHRRAHSFQGCLSPTTTPLRLYFNDSSDGVGQTESHPAVKKAEALVQAETLVNLLGKLGRKTVDFWSLDVEGSEAQVLNATRFDKIEVGVLLVAMNKAEENNAGVKEVMLRVGFIDIGTTTNNAGLVVDHIFVNPGYFKSRGLQVPTMHLVYSHAFKDFVVRIFLAGPNGCNARWFFWKMATVAVFAGVFLMARNALHELHEYVLARDGDKYSIKDIRAHIRKTLFRQG